MNKINILGKYDVNIGTNLIKSLKDFVDLDRYSKIIVITDENLAPLYFGEIKNVIPNAEKIVVACGEENKNMETVQEIWKKLLQIGADRKSLVINLGGGVIGDMGGFASSTFMRGIDFLQIPTTLLSQVDASVGGKVGVNFAEVKNLIGGFNQPIGVICDISVLKTLGDREFIEGFGEIIKHGIILDKDYFNFVTSKKPKEFNEEELIEIVKRSCELKKQIVEEDVEEKNRRRLVNFGHTMGHALESLSLESGKQLFHGEAISIGMVAEGKISVLKGLLSEEELRKIIQALENAGLPIKFKSDQEKVLKKIKSDKKSEKGVVYFTLISQIGKAEVGQEVSDGELKTALQFIS